MMDNNSYFDTIEDLCHLFPMIPTINCSCDNEEVRNITKDFGMDYDLCHPGSQPSHVTELKYEPEYSQSYAVIITGSNFLPKLNEFL